MFDQMGGDIEIRIEDKEEHEDRHRRLDPEHLQGKDHDAAEDDGQVHGDDPLVRPKELLNDVYGSFRLLVPVSEIRVEVIYKEEGTGEPDVGIREMNGSKEPGFHDKGVISPVEETVVNGEEPGKEALVVPDVAGVDRALPTPHLVPDFLFTGRISAICSWYSTDAFVRSVAFIERLPTRTPYLPPATNHSLWIRLSH